MDRDMSSRRSGSVLDEVEEDEEEDSEDEVAIPRPLVHRLARLELVFAE